MAANLEYTLFLSTDDVRLAHHLARIVGQKGGTAVLARGKETGGQAAVVVNIVDWGAFPLLRVLETVRAAARQFNIEVTGATLGPVPLEALLAVARQALALRHQPVIAEAGLHLLPPGSTTGEEL